jgi:DNA-binding Lrp family transcriptional regulator
MKMPAKPAVLLQIPRGGEMKTASDNTDLMILRELRSDCKRPVRELAQVLHMHPNTLLQRIKKLETSGIIQKYIAEVDYAKLGYDLHALVSIKVNKDARSKWPVLDELRAFKDIVALYAVTGSYDVMAIVRTKNRETLTTLLMELNKKPYIVETNSTLVLYPFKDAHEFNPL